MTSIVTKKSMVYHFWHNDVNKDDNFYWACLPKSRQCPKSGPFDNMDLKDLQIPTDHKMITLFLLFSAYKKKGKKREHFENLDSYLKKLSVFIKSST